jgi:Tol biopolymer transport system component
MLMLANTDGSDIKVLANQKLPEVFGSLSSPAWSPDGKIILHSQILGSDKKYTLVAIDIHNGTIKQFCPQKWLSIHSIDWLDDGSGLFVVSRSQTSNYQIWYLSYPGRELKRITTDLNNYRGVSLMADGGSLITVLSEQNSSIYVSRLGSEDNAKQITRGRYDGQRGISCLPDGKILHASRDYKLWLINSDGTNAQRLTPDDRRDFSPSVSPDGQTIFFTTVRGSLLELWKMNVDGTKAVQIAPLSAYPRCAPNGDWIVYGSVVDDKLTIMKMSITNGNAFQLTDKSAYGPDISPDGNKIACYLGNESQPDKLTIAVFPFEGGEPELIFDFSNDVLPSSFLRWTPDGSAITYIAEQGGISNIWSQPLDGSPSKQISNFKEKLIFAFDWSKDGSLVFSRGTIENDVVLIKDIK